MHGFRAFQILVNSLPISHIPPLTAVSTYEQTISSWTFDQSTRLRLADVFDEPLSQSLASLVSPATPIYLGFTEVAAEILWFRWIRLHIDLHQQTLDTSDL